VLAATVAAAQTPSDTYTRDHEHGTTTLRFEKSHFQFALVLDARPKTNQGRDLVTAGGRDIPLDWSGRSAWIDHAKFELPFGAVFLLSLKDSTPARQLAFGAISGRLLLDQAAKAPPVIDWIAKYGAPLDTVAPGASQAETYPRHTLELTEWWYRGAHAVTCVVSGEPQFVLISTVPLHGGSSAQTAFGNFKSVDVQVGESRDGRTWHATKSQAVLGNRTYDFTRGRVFLLPPGGGDATQVQTALDLGPGAAGRITDAIERTPEVRTFLQLR